MKRHFKKAFTYAFGLAVLAGIVYAFLPKPVDVDIDRVTRGPLRVTVDEDGKTRIKERYVVSAPLAGRLLRIQLHEGDAVQSGQTLLATIEPVHPDLLDPRALAQAEARVKWAEASLAQTKPTLEKASASWEFSKYEHARILKLVGQKAKSQQDLDEAIMNERVRGAELKAANFAVEIARFELEQAQAALLRTRPSSEKDSENSVFDIRAPISGKVLRVLQKSATVVTSGVQLVELGNPADMEVEIDVLSSDAVKIEPGAKVLLEHWGGDQPLVGTVRLIEPAAFTKVSALGVEEQRVNVIVDFVEPPDRRPTLGDAFRVEARIVLWEQEDVLRVPTSALFRQGDGWAVYQVVEGRASLRSVKIGRRNGLEAEVLEGVQPGDRVIVHPSDKIAQNVKIVAR